MTFVRAVPEGDAPADVAAMYDTYCTLAHASVLMDNFVEPDELRAIVTDHHDAGLDPVDVAVMDLADKVVVDATSVTQEDIDRLRALGLSDTDIFEVIVAAAVRCFWSKALDALGVLPDAHYNELDPELHGTLVVGRPIAEQ